VETDLCGTSKPLHNCTGEVSKFCVTLYTYKYGHFIMQRQKKYILLWGSVHFSKCY